MSLGGGQIKSRTSNKSSRVKWYCTWNFDEENLIRFDKVICLLFSSPSQSNVLLQFLRNNGSRGYLFCNIQGLYLRAIPCMYAWKKFAIELIFFNLRIGSGLVVLVRERVVFVTRLGEHCWCPIINHHTWKWKTVCLMKILMNQYCHHIIKYYQGNMLESCSETMHCLQLTWRQLHWKMLYMCRNHCSLGSANVLSILNRWWWWWWWWRWRWSFANCLPRFGFHKTGAISNVSFLQVFYIQYSHQEISTNSILI